MLLATSTAREFESESLFIFEHGARTNYNLHKRIRTLSTMLTYVSCNNDNSEQSYADRSDMWLLSSLREVSDSV